MPKTSARLLITSPPKPDEGLLGYLVRLTELNSYESPSWILTLGGLRWSGDGWKWPTVLFGSGASLRRLAQVTALRLAELKAMAYPPVESQEEIILDHLFFGSPIPRHAIRPERPKICPPCLKESAYYRRVWDLKLITCCPFHKCLLVDECPGCTKRIKWHRATVCSCPCGFTLSDIRTTPVNNEVLSLVNRLYCLFGLNFAIEEESITNSNPLSRLNLKHTIIAILFISSRLLIKGRITGGGMRSLRNQEIHDLLLRTTSVFEGWPDSFYEFIDLKRAQAGKPRAHYMKTHFGEFYEDLFKNPRLMHTELDFFRDSFKTYLELRWDGRLVRRVKPKLKYITKCEATKQIGIQDKWFKRYVSEGKLILIVQPGLTMEHHYVDAESVRRLKDELSRLVRVHAVARSLGISDSIVRNLVEAGCIVPLRGPKIDGYRWLMFDEKAAGNLISMVMSHLTDERLLSTCAQDLNKIVEQFSPMNAGLATKVRAILDGNLLPKK